MADNFWAPWAKKSYIPLLKVLTCGMNGFGAQWHGIIFTLPYTLWICQFCFIKQYLVQRCRREVWNSDLCKWHTTFEGHAITYTELASIQNIKEGYQTFNKVYDTYRILHGKFSKLTSTIMVCKTNRISMNLCSLFVIQYYNICKIWQGQWNLFKTGCTMTHCDQNNGELNLNFSKLSQWLHKRAPVQTMFHSLCQNTLRHSWIRHNLKNDRKRPINYLFCTWLFTFKLTAWTSNISTVKS